MNYLVTKVASIVALSIGALLKHLYLLSVRSGHLVSIYALFVGVILESIGILLALEVALSDRACKSFFLLCIAFLSFSVTFMQVTRFTVPFEGDAVLEYATATEVQKVTRWDPTQQLLPYNIYPSTTILPSIISQILGIPLFVTFSIVFPIIISLMHIVFSATILRYFGDSKLSYLSAAIIPQVFFYQLYIQNYRSTIAILFFYLIILSLTLRDRVGTILTSILGIGLAFSHFTVGYFAIITLLLFLVAPLLFKFFGKAYERSVSNPKVGIVVGEFALWSLYGGGSVTEWNLRELNNLYRTWVEGTADISWWGSWPTGSPRGTIVTAWFDLQFILIGIGALIMLYDCCARSKKGMPSWTLVGSASVALILATVYVPGFGRLVGLERLILYSLPFLMIFLATSILRVKQHVKIVCYIFLILLLPMNMMLPAHQLDPLFHPVTSLPTNRAAERARLRYSDIVASTFINQHLLLSEDEFIGTDLLARTGLRLIGMKDYQTSETLITLNGTLNPKCRYYVFSDILISTGWFVISYYYVGKITPYWVKFDPDELLKRTSVNLIYTDGSLSLAQNMTVKL